MGSFCNFLNKRLEVKLMRKILFAAVLALGLIIGQATQVEALEAYMGTWEGGWKAYLVDIGEFTSNADETESYQLCTLKAVSPRGTVKFIYYKFTLHYNGEHLSYISFVDSEGGSGRFTDKNPGVYEVENKVIVSILMAYREQLGD